MASLSISQTKLLTQQTQAVGELHNSPLFLKDLHELTRVYTGIFEFTRIYSRKLKFTHVSTSISLGHFITAIIPDIRKSLLTFFTPLPSEMSLLSTVYWRPESIGLPCRSRWRIILKGPYIHPFRSKIYAG